MLNNYNDPKVWEIFQEGKTKGIFQLESNLGRNWSKKLKPRNIEELSGLVSLLRPGCLNAITDGKSMTQHYVDRKHKLEEITYIHPSLEEFLNVTYGVICYQEQVMRIAQKLAGFTLEETDDLRKAIGKKKADLMNKVEIKFIEGCKNVGIVPDDVAREIFNWIKKSAKYLFNKCLSPNTTVFTKNGIKLLSEIKIGDFVLAPTKEGLEDEYVEVLDIIHNGKKELFRVEMDDGKFIECTLDHKFLCKDGEIRPLIDILEEDFEIMCIETEKKMSFAQTTT